MNKKEILSLICALEKNPGLLTKQHLKKIYALLIACGHYPICPWCKKPIYNINDFSWDHIKPLSSGGADTLDNLQPMHKHCNNVCKQDIVYKEDYTYNIKSGMEEAAYSVRITVSKKRAATNKQKDAATVSVPRSRNIKNNVKRR